MCRRGRSLSASSRAQCRRHAQINQRSQAAQAGRDGAAELIVAEVTAGTEALSVEARWRRHAGGSTHIRFSAVRLPRLGGIVPLSWLV